MNDENAKLKVSIIVPVYNVENYIEKCLDSLLSQSLKEIEIIVVNDGSTDNSYEIIKSIMDKHPNRIQYFIKKNGGQGSARNLGIEHARGEYLSFVDSDDYIDENFARDMYNAAKSENADVAVCDMVDVYSDKQIYHNTTDFNKIYETTPSVCNKVFKKEIFEGIEFLSRYWYEDLHVMCNLYNKIKKVVRIKKGYYFCHCREVSTMINNNSQKNLDMLYILNDAKQFINQEGEFNSDAFKYIVFEHVLITSINRVSKQKNKEKKAVLDALLQFCKAEIPDYNKKQFYRDISLKRKIAAWLNYHGLYNMTKWLLYFNSIIK